MRNSASLYPCPSPTAIRVDGPTALTLDYAGAKLV